MTQQCVLHPQDQDYVVMIPTQNTDPQCYADSIDKFISVVKLYNTVDILPVNAMVGLAKLVWENAVSDWINSVWLVNDQVKLDTYQTLY